jgi:Protein of unknown function (DUF2975)
MLLSIYLSLFDKKDLTNGIGGVILCAMNANEMTQKPNSRLNRIRKISRNLKVCVLIYFVPLCLMALNFKSAHMATGMVSVFNHPYASVSDIPAPMYALVAIAMGLYLLGVISFYRLLNLFEKGVIFAAASVSEIKRLGIFLAAYGILSVVAKVIYTRQILFPWTLLDAVSSPWIVAGVAIYLVAWIMDEGRKIQEEQELTV